MRLNQWPIQVVICCLTYDASEFRLLNAERGSVRRGIEAMPPLGAVFSQSQLWHNDDWGIIERAPSVTPLLKVQPQRLAIGEGDSAIRQNMIISDRSQMLVAQ